MTRFLIKFVRLFKKIFISAGVDFEQLIAIVTIKLTMDNRRNNASMMRGKRDESKESNNRFAKTLLVYAFLGIFISLYVVAIDIPIISMSIFHGFIMVMLAMTLITDYSSILLDTADNMILLPRPIDSRTLFTARLTHISLYIGQVLFAVAIVPALIVGFKYGFIVLLIFILTAILSALFALFLTSILYLIIMRMTSEERLKDIINYLQIGMAIFIFAFYQLMPRLFEIKDIENVSFEPSWWNFFVPPMWMGGTMDAFITGNFDPTHLLLILLCCVVPILGLVEMNRSFSTFFSQKLAGLSTEYNAAETTSPPSPTPSTRGDASTVRKPIQGDLSTRLSTYITSSPVESGVFQLVWKQLSRDRKIRLRLYPQFAYFFVMLIVILFSIFRRSGGIDTIWEELPETKWYLMFIYFGSTTLSASLALVPYSDDFKAAWVYFSLPIAKPGEVLLGSLKAQIFKFFLPFYAILSFILLSIWHLSVIDDLIFGLLNILIIALVYSVVNTPLLPFSEETNTQAQSGSFIRSLVNMLTFIVVAGLHYLATLVPYLTWALMPVQVLIIYLLIKKYRDTAWKDVNMASF
jgi:ABC-2 type transport system permease protein